MKTVIEMAREAGWKDLRDYDSQMRHDFFLGSLDSLEHFAELVRADEREKYKWDIHSCGPTCQRYACVAMREAVEAEREACAMWAWSAVLSMTDSDTADKVLAAIRARGNT